MKWQVLIENSSKDSIKWKVMIGRDNLILMEASKTKLSFFKPVMQIPKYSQIVLWSFHGIFICGSKSAFLNI